MQFLHFRPAQIFALFSFMWLISILLAFTLLTGSISEQKFFHFVTDKLHSYCLLFVPESKNSPLTQAVVCGSQKQIPQNQLQLLKNSGLIHLIVVSASHLLFLEWFLGIFRTPFSLRLLVLFFYALTTNLQPPVLRALLQMLCERLNAIFRLFWSPLETILVSCLLLLCINPSYLESYSALLSYCAALACSSKNSSLLKNTVVYVLILPVLINMSAPHPFSILLNLAFAPLIGFFIFPLSLLSLVLPLSKILDIFWDLFFEILNALDLESIQSSTLLPLTSLWIYALTLNCLIVLKEKYEISRMLHSIDGS